MKNFSGPFDKFKLELKKNIRKTTFEDIKTYLNSRDCQHMIIILDPLSPSY